MQEQVNSSGKDDVLLYLYVQQLRSCKPRADSSHGYRFVLVINLLVEELVRIR